MNFTMLIFTITVPSVGGSPCAEMIDPVNPGFGQGGGSSCWALVDTSTLTSLLVEFEVER